jgi:hypothetical protein
MNNKQNNKNNSQNNKRQQQKKQLQKIENKVKQEVNVAKQVVGNFKKAFKKEVSRQHMPESYYNAQAWKRSLVNPTNVKCRGISNGIMPTGLVSFSSSTTVTIGSGGCFYAVYTPNNVAGNNAYTYFIPNADGSASQQEEMSSYQAQFSVVQGNTADVYFPSPDAFLISTAVIPAPLSEDGLGVDNCDEWRVTAAELIGLPTGALLTQGGYTVIGGMTQIPDEWLASTSALTNASLENCNFKESQSNLYPFHCRWFPIDETDTALGSNDQTINKKLTLLTDGEYGRETGVIYFLRVCGPVGSQFRFTANSNIEFTPKDNIRPFIQVTPPTFRFDCITDLTRMLMTEIAFQREIIGPHKQISSTSGFNFSGGGGFGGGGAMAKDKAKALTSVKPHVRPEIDYHPQEEQKFSPGSKATPQHSYYPDEEDGEDGPRIDEDFYIAKRKQSDTEYVDGYEIAEVVGALLPGEQLAQQGRRNHAPRSRGGNQASANRGQHGRTDMNGRTKITH